MPLFLLTPVAVAVAPGLSPAAIAGIVSGGAALIGGGASALWYYLTPKSKTKKSPQHQASIIAQGKKTQMRIKETQKSLETLSEDINAATKETNSTAVVIKKLSNDLQKASEKDDKEAQEMKEAIHTVQTAREIFSSSLPSMEKMAAEIYESSKEIQTLNNIKKENELPQHRSEILSSETIIGKQNTVIAKLEEKIEKMDQQLKKAVEYLELANQNCQYYKSIVEEQELHRLSLGSSVSLSSI